MLSGVHILQPFLKRTLWFTCALSGAFLACGLVVPLGDHELKELDGGIEPVKIDAGTCGQPQTFCDDFDTPPLEARWDKVHTGGESQVSLSTEFAVSSPNAMLSEGDGVSSLIATLEKTIAGGANGMSCAVDVYIDGSQIGIVLLSLSLVTTAGEFATIAVYEDGKVSLNYRTDADGGAYFNNSLGMGKVPAKVWGRLEVAMTKSPTAFQVRLNGHPLLSQPLPFTESLASYSVNVGISYPGGTKVRVFYDNVVCANL